MRVLAEEGTNQMIEEIKKLKSNTGASGTTLFTKYFETLTNLTRTSADNPLYYYAFQPYDENGPISEWVANDWEALKNAWKKQGIDYRDVLELAKAIDPTINIMTITVNALFWVFSHEYLQLTCTDIGWGTQGYSYANIFAFSDIPFIKFITSRN